MADLTNTMSNEQIDRLDYFEKIQLYYNVYRETPYNQIPPALRKFAIQDDGLLLVKSILANSPIQNPYEIAKLIKAINPVPPATLQEVYQRAVYLADVCDTSVENILKSDIFNTKNFIPQLDEEILDETIKNGNMGLPITLDNEDYTPSPDSGDSSGDDTPIPGPTPSISGDYAEEKKIYFNYSNNNVTCSTTYADIVAMSPKLPAAELIIKNSSGTQNIDNISCDYDNNEGAIYFNFIHFDKDYIKLHSICYTSNSLTIDENNLIIDSSF